MCLLIALSVTVGVIITSVGGRLEIMLLISVSVASVRLRRAGEGSLACGSPSGLFLILKGLRASLGGPSHLHRFTDDVESVRTFVYS